MTEFMRPTVTTEEVNETVARFIVEPLERGYGYTLGNCMRRVLLSSLDGAKATAIQIDGVQHEFTTAEGVIEDITDIVLNVKGLVFSALNDDIEEATAHVSAEGPCTVTGADLDIPTEFTLVNPEHVIATVADGGQLDMTIRIGVGRAQQAHRGPHRHHPCRLAVLAGAPLHAQCHGYPRRPAHGLRQAGAGSGDGRQHLAFRGRVPRF